VVDVFSLKGDRLRPNLRTVGHRSATKRYAHRHPRIPATARCCIDWQCRDVAMSSGTANRTLEKVKLAKRQSLPERHVSKEIAALQRTKAISRLKTGAKSKGRRPGRTAWGITIFLFSPKYNSRTTALPYNSEQPVLVATKNDFVHGVDDVQSLGRKSCHARDRRRQHPVILMLQSGCRGLWLLTSQ
jgi:hypothetical protein